MLKNNYFIVDTWCIVYSEEDPTYIKEIFMKKVNTSNFAKMEDIIKQYIPDAIVTPGIDTERYLQREYVGRYTEDNELKY